MPHLCPRIIREEHAALASILRLLTLMVERGPKRDTETFFTVLRAMLFYVDEFPERLHHPKETELLFPTLRHSSPQISADLDRLDREHTNTRTREGRGQCSRVATLARGLEIHLRSTPRRV